MNIKFDESIENFSPKRNSPEVFIMSPNNKTQDVNKSNTFSLMISLMNNKIEKSKSNRNSEDD